MKIEDRHTCDDAILDPHSSSARCDIRFVSTGERPLCGSFYRSDSNPVEANSRPAPITPSPYGVEELDTVYGPLVAAQINGARLAAGWDLKYLGVEAPNADASTPLALRSAILQSLVVPPVMSAGMSVVYYSGVISVSVPPVIAVIIPRPSVVTVIMPLRRD